MLIVDSETATWPAAPQPRHWLGRYLVAVAAGGLVAGFATLCWVDMDCADPSELAEFYCQVLGWNVTHYQDESESRRLFTFASGRWWLPSLPSRLPSDPSLFRASCGRAASSQVPIRTASAPGLPDLG